MRPAGAFCGARVPNQHRTPRQHTDGLAWNHETSTLCALAALLLYLRGLSGLRPTSFALSGLLLGGAIGIRITFAPVVVPFLLSFWLSRSPVRRGQRLGGLLLWSLGMTVGVLPAIVPADPSFPADAKRSRRAGPRWRSHRAPG